MDDKAVIIGTVNWQEVGTLPDGSAERQNSRAVAYLDLPAEGARCTAFLVAPNVIMTNHHCVPQASAAAGARALFRYEVGGPASDVGVDCSVFLGNDATLDYALLQCAGRPGDLFGVVELEATTMAGNAGVYVVHQNCDYYQDPSCAPTKKYSPGRVVASGNEISHDADTLGGSSGSPLFSRATHKVVGLHHVGIGNDGAGHGSENRAVPIARILPVLQARYPGLELGARAPVDEPAANAPASPGAADGYEPNDTVPGAVQVALPFASVDARVDAGDVDHFAFVADGAAHTVRLGLRHADGDLDLYILDARGQELAHSTGTTDAEEVTAAFPAGPIVVRVVGYRGALGAYALTVQ